MILSIDNINYVKNNLLEGEKVESTAKIHWLIFYKAVIVTTVFLFRSFFVWSEFIYFTLIGIIFVIESIIFRKFAEVVLTNKRIIIKYGILETETQEISYSKIESVSLKQNIIQSILKTGTITITGFGTTKSKIPFILDPFSFRKDLMKKLDEAV